MLHTHLPAIARWRRRRLWPLALEASASLLWVVSLAVAVLLTVIATLGTGDIPVVLLGFAWGIAVSVVATLQLAFALRIDFPYDRQTALAFLLGPVYPIAYWAISAAAALRAEVPALLRGSRGHRISRDIAREATTSRR